MQQLDFSLKQAGLAGRQFPLAHVQCGPTDSPNQRRDGKLWACCGGTRAASTQTQAREVHEMYAGGSDEHQLGMSAKSSEPKASSGKGSVYRNTERTSIKLLQNDVITLEV